MIADLFARNISKQLLNKVRRLANTAAFKYKLTDVSAQGLFDMLLRQSPNEQEEDWQIEEDSINILQELRRGLVQDIVANLMILTPVETGKLLNSLYVNEGSLTTEIGFDTDYMVYVHECEYKHKAPASYKFLEKAVDAAYEKWKGFSESLTYHIEISTAPNTLKVVINSEENDYTPIGNSADYMQSLRDINFKSMSGIATDEEKIRLGAAEKYGLLE